MKCEVHPDCSDEAVARVGVPSPHAVWVCRRGFDEFERREGPFARAAAHGKRTVGGECGGAEPPVSGQDDPPLP